MTEKAHYSRSGCQSDNQTSGNPRRGVLLAAHGSRRQVQADNVVQEHALRLQAEYGFQEVAVAFRQGEPSFSEVIDSMTSREVTVVPFFSSDGYFSRTVLPRELALNRCYSRMRVQFTDPVGTHPRIPALVKRRTQEIFRRCHLKPEWTALLVVGHGTRRHATSRSSTLKLVHHLDEAAVCANIQPAFLDESPLLEEAFHDLPQKAIVIVPFFMGESYHVLEDIPRRLGWSESISEGFPAEKVRGGRRVIVDRTVGLDPELTTVVAELLGCQPTGGGVGMSEAVT